MIEEATFQLRSRLLHSLITLLRVGDLYQLTAEPPERPATRAETRARLTALLERANAQHPFFAGRFTAFLAESAALDERAFFARYAQLPVFTEEDYRQAGLRLMARGYGERVAELELRFDGGIAAAVRQLRSPDFIFPMATGGSSKLPLTVQMTKEHTFANLFTLFRCWRKMGWRLGDKTLIFYPAQTYNIDDLAAFNRLSALTGIQFLLFRRLDSSTVARLVDTLNRFRPRLLLAFPSPLNRVAHLIRSDKLPLRHQPELINTGGETFLDCQRKNIARVFRKSRVQDSYGSVELGQIAHEGVRGLELFSDLAYVEQGRDSELIVTRLDLIDFPFIRYQMRDVAQLGDGVMLNLEGKDTSFVSAPSGQRLRPSFFNRMVNAVNARFPDSPVIEVKVIERSLSQWEVRLVTLEGANRREIERAVQDHLKKEIGDEAQALVRFVDEIEHDYRLKYRVVERQGDTEDAGGIIGNQEKIRAVGRE
jgi:phenylacetate-coenzyme A ligase PaaK-like adenylate-forming protein